MSVTADSTLWTADTICITADGRVICIDAVVAEPVGGQGPTADTTLYTADSIVLTADGGAVAGAIDTLDAAVEVIGGAIIPVDVVEAAAALDQLDADVFPEIVAVPGGAHYPRRRLLPVIGVGYGILPQLWGEAHGVVGVVGAGVGTTSRPRRRSGRFSRRCGPQRSATLTSARRQSARAARAVRARE